MLTLPRRYLGRGEGGPARIAVRLADLGQSWEIDCGELTARVRKGAGSRSPHVTISTDSETWVALRAGELSGLQAFSERRLAARGDLDLAVAIEGMFRLPNGREPHLSLRDVRVGKLRVSTLSLGAGPDVLLLHGLGATKTSFFDTAAKLAQHYRVHVLDHPGFGSSSKPAGAPYDAPWFAQAVLGVMDELEIERAHLVGNSMGGRIAIEVGLRAPERVSALALLCPSVAFVRRDLLPLVRLLRPELGVLPHTIARRTVAGQFWSLFADRDVVDPAVADIAVDEFRRIYGSAGARLAFLTAARNIYLDAPFGRQGFYPRLAELQPPALFVWGTHDRLVPAGLGHHVRKWLPQAEQIVIEGCGHVPQIERPAQTNGLLLRFFRRSEALTGAVTALRRAA